MTNFIEILKYIGPFIGVYIGWILTKRSESEKIKYNEIRQVKKCLYTLLEIRNQLIISQRVDSYLSVLIERMKSDMDCQGNQTINSQLFRELAIQLINSLIGETYLKDIKKQFMNSIDNLSEIDPLLAYRINGKQNIQDYLNSWEAESKKYFGFESMEDIQKVIEIFKPKLIDEIRNDLEVVILDIAALINDKDLRKVKEFIREPLDITIQEEVEKYYDKIFAGII